jgi:hypothetical protein
MSQFNANPPQRPQPSLPDPGQREYGIPEKSPSKPKRWVPWVGGGLVGLLAGLVFGTAGGSNSATDAAEYATTHPVVTKTVTPPPVVKTVPTVPAACKTALEAADEALATAGQGFSIIADVMSAVSEFNVDAIEAGTQKLATLNKDKLTPQLEAYKTARDECQS